jgi:hypothetical protein
VAFFVSETNLGNYLGNLLERTGPSRDRRAASSRTTQQSNRLPGCQKKIGANKYRYRAESGTSFMQMPISAFDPLRKIQKLKISTN